jgi:hypothetical protein
VKINTVVIPNSIIVSVSMGCPISVSVLGLGLGAVKRSSASKLGRRDCLRQPFKLKLVLNVEATWTMNKRRANFTKSPIKLIESSRHGIRRLLCARLVQTSPIFYLIDI